MKLSYEITDEMRLEANKCGIAIWDLRLRIGAQYFLTGMFYGIPIAMIITIIAIYFL